MPSQGTAGAARNRGGDAASANANAEGAQRLLQEALQRNLRADVRDVAPPAEGGLRHGELMFSSTGKVVKYLLVPASHCFKPDVILSTVLSPKLWGLAAPNLTVQPMGPRGYWPDAVETVLDEKKKQAWGKDEEARCSKYKAKITQLGSGILRAIVESGGWMWSTCVSYESHDHAGVVFQGAIDAFNRENPVTPLVYMAAKPMSNIVIPADSPFPFDVEKPFQIFFPSQVDLAENAKPVGEAVEKRVVLPDVGEFIWPKTGEGRTRTIGAARCAIPHFVTHLILFDNVSPVYPELSAHVTCMPHLAFEALLTTSMPHAAVIIAGKNTSRVFDYSADLSERGCSVIVLDNTGEMADRLCRAVVRHRKDDGVLTGAEMDAARPEGEEVLRENCNPQKYLLFDALTVNAEKVVSTLTKTLTIVPGADTNELGFAANEKARLRDAWRLHVSLRYNATHHRRVAYAMHYSIVLCSFATTLAVVLNEVLGHRHDLSSEPRIYVSMSCAILPLVSTLVQSVLGTLSPVSKFAYLALGSAQVKSVIYKYRARVGEFSPSSTQAQVTEALAHSRESASKPPGSAAQANFAAALEGVQTAALADMKDSSVRQPPRRMFEAMMAPVQAGTYLSVQDTEPENGTAPRSRTLMHELADSHQSGVPYSLLEAVVREDDRLFDDFASLLSGEDYLQFRLLPMLAHYTAQTSYLECTYRGLQILMFLSTFLAALLSILDLKIWVPVAVAAASSVGSVLDFNKVQTRLSNCNRARIDLENLHRWWSSLSMVKRRTRVCKDTLVEQTEHAADAEESVWAKSLLTAKKADDEKEGGKNE